MTTTRLSAAPVLLSILMMLTVTVGAFVAPSDIAPRQHQQQQCYSSTHRSQLYMANEEDMMRWARSSRAASANDRVVELKRPLGLVLTEDDNGNVYVETIAPRGNAARAGGIKEGDLVTMCSATFGNDMWSTRGVGLTRVLAAIRVRSGPTVKLAFENVKESKTKAATSAKQAKAMEEARLAAQAKKDALLSQLEQDEKKLTKKNFFGLF